MFCRKTKHLAILIVLTVLIFAPSTTWAATLNVALDKLQGAIGDTVTANIKINSEGTGINVAQATLQFSKDILEAKSVDKTGSIFNFWLKDPAFSNDTGQIDFVGGSPSGFVGPSLQVLTITFKVKGNGQANLVFTDGSVNASDGSGTNVLNTMKGAQFVAGPKTDGGPLVTQGAAILPSVPLQISRQPVAAKSSPLKPQINVPLYPDSSKWYNLSSDFSVSWDLPLDVSDVSIAINKDPSWSSQKSEGLFNNKNFGALSDGVWYVHVRFQNNIGWGPVAHYKISVDTQPPSSFTPKLNGVSATDKTVSTDDPAPSVTYSIGDNLSGIDFYFLRVDDGDLIKTDKTSFTLPLQTPGNHSVLVGAQDKAGNITENFIKLETLPIESPAFNLAATNLFVGEGGLFASGTALPNVKIIFIIKQSKGEIVYTLSTTSQDDGKWEMKADQPLKKGSYVAEVTAQDKRGALSLPVKSDFKVKERPLLTLGGIEITQFWFFVGLLIILLVGVFSGWILGIFTKEQRERKSIIAQRDVASVLGLVKKDISKALSKFADKKIDGAEATEIEFLLKHCDETINKMQKYILENIEEINQDQVSLKNIAKDYLKKIIK